SRKAGVSVWIVRWREHQYGNAPHRVGLRVRYQRASRRAGEDSDEFAPSHRLPRDLRQAIGSCPSTTSLGLQRPLWVRSRHLRRKRSCPLYTPKRTFRLALGMSTKGNADITLHRRHAFGHLLRTELLAAPGAEAPLPPDPHLVLSGEQCVR